MLELYGDYDGQHKFKATVGNISLLVQIRPSLPVDLGEQFLSRCGSQCKDASSFVRGPSSE